MKASGAALGPRRTAKLNEELRVGEIPLAARRVSVVDAVDALTSDRPAWSEAQARTYLREQARAQLEFDLVRLSSRAC